MIDGVTPEMVLLSAVVSPCLSAGAVTAAKEWFWLRDQGRLDAAARREMRLSLGMLPPNLVVSILMSGVWGALYMAGGQFAPWHLDSGPTAVLAVFILADLSYYWEHRCAHKVSLLWRLYHAAHHSSPAYTIATAYRVSFFNQLLAPAFYLPWVLLGFPPLLVLAGQLFCFHYQAWLHTEMIGTLGPLDRWFNTPANHRVHHGTAEAHRDRNFGAVLMLWDRLFGTWAPPTAVAAVVRYGIAGEASPRRVRDIYLNPWRPWLRWRRANSLRGKE